MRWALGTFGLTCRRRLYRDRQLPLLVHGQYRYRETTAHTSRLNQLRLTPLCCSRPVALQSRLERACGLIEGSDSTEVVLPAKASKAPTPTAQAIARRSPLSPSRKRVRHPASSPFLNRLISTLHICPFYTPPLHLFHVSIPAYLPVRVCSARHLSVNRFKTLISSRS